jgi:hypothetical protein
MVWALWVLCGCCVNVTGDGGGLLDRLFDDFAIRLQSSIKCSKAKTLRPPFRLTSPAPR